MLGGFALITSIEVLLNVKDKLSTNEEPKLFIVNIPCDEGKKITIGKSEITTLF
jgi:hypothetical protein